MSDRSGKKAVMSSRNAAELDYALERNGWTPKDVKNLSQGNLLARILPVIRGQAEVVPFARQWTWTEQNGIIRFSVTSNGLTGEQWAVRLGKKYRLSKSAKSVLFSPDFKPTLGITTEIAVIKGELFDDDMRTIQNVREDGSRLKFIKPKAEIACLIREKFTNQDISDMGLVWVIAMHNPIKDFDGDPVLLGASRDDDGNWLKAYREGPVAWWVRDGGFAFAVSQVS